MTVTPLLPVRLAELLTSIEETYIDEALRITRGRRKAAADLLGLKRTTLVEKLRRRAVRRAKAASAEVDGPP